MEDEFKIFVEQLRDGREKRINECLSPDFLEINEPDLAFDDPVELKGLAYLAEEELIINWDIRTVALISCAICNEKVPVDIVIENFYHSEPIEGISTGIYNFKQLLRDTILLEVPSFAECNGGDCPRRKEIAKYLKGPSSEHSNDEEGYQPFADLDIKLK